MKWKGQPVVTSDVTMASAKSQSSAAKSHSIHRRFSRAFIGIVTLILLVFASLGIFLNVTRIENELKKNLDNVVELSKISLPTPLWNLDNDIVQDYIEALFLDDALVYAEVVWEGSVITAKTRPKFQGQAFDFFEQSSKFITKTADILFEGSQVGSIRFALSRASINRELVVSIVGIIALTVFLIVAISITSIVTTRRSIARPLLQLQQSATSIASGDLEAAINTSSQDEIGSLARDLNAMRESIKQLFGALRESNAQLEESNQTLEDRVTERTHELQEKNAELEETLMKLQEMQNQMITQEKMVALGGLVAGVAHEINTPVGIGVTAASLLRDRTAAFEDIYKSGQMKRSDLEKYLDTADQSSTMLLSNLNRAAELIQSFKQVAVDQSTEGHRRFSVKTYMDEILLSLRPKLKRTQHRIDVRADDDLELNSDPGAFSQIVTNLVLNSITHAYEPDEQGHMVFDFTPRGDRLIFVYSDDGCGIPPDNLDKIFEPFFTTRRGQGGSGLGLHIIYNLITQKLGGTIRCESEVGVGTRFIIELPMSTIDETS